MAGNNNARARRALLIKRCVGWSSSRAAGRRPGGALSVHVAAVAAIGQQRIAAGLAEQLHDHRVHVRGHALERAADHDHGAVVQPGLELFGLGGEGVLHMAVQPETQPDPEASHATR